jgi:beta-glucanase (GH16 family)
MTVNKIHLLIFTILLCVTQLFAQNSIPVKIEKTKDGFQLIRNGKPYFIKGAGGTSYIEKLKEYGGNSIRTWSSTNAKAILDEAHRLGLTVTLGLSTATERHGFNYDDVEAVKSQLEILREEVIKYKDHPALLAWGIGNELNLHYSNTKVWDAVEDIAKMIKSEDKNHLVTTMLAGINQKEIDLIKSKCPSLDMIAVQVYGGLAGVPEQIRKVGWNKAYIVTEWGPTGHWEGQQTQWKASIEETSKEKAAVYKSRYEASIASDKNCLGSYVFLWGQKQERTPTWYGLFTEDGLENEVVDVMQYLWTGNWPANRAPRLDSKKASDHIYLKSGEKYSSQVFVEDPDNDNMKVHWEILHESTDLKEGGDRESRPDRVESLLEEVSFGRATIVAPAKAGAYRIFVYVTDGNNHVATANIPFYVTASTNATSVPSQEKYTFASTPTWADEFNYTGLPDTTKWSYDVGSLYNGWGNNELQYYTKADPKNVLVKDGKLKIIALQQKKEGLDYTSTRLVSKSKGDFVYGRFEARAKVPKGRGTWPAIWMLPTASTYGGWPNSGEIDILEHVGYDMDVVHISVHTKAYHHSIQTQKTATKKIQDASEQFHLYRIDWTPDYIKGFVDDVEIFHFDNEKKSYLEWPFDQKFHWLINLAVGGFWGGLKGIDEKAFPATFEVDYVRVYDLIQID